MKVGYACINTSIKENFRTCRVATVEKKGPEILKELTLENLKLTKRIIEWNIGHGIKFYRMTSEMVVLATHPVNPWDWRNDPDVIQICSEIKALRDEHGLRLSTHPGQYSVLNSPNPDVVDRTIADLDYHAALSELTGAQDMILHLGGKYGDPEAALGRLVNETRALPEPILKRLRFENDDRTYNLEDVLSVSEATGVPACFDIHHHRCNPADAPLEGLIDRVYETWKTTGTPKVHISSGKTAPNDRRHHDFIFPEDVDWLLDVLAGRNADIMVEAKAKERAALGVIQELGERGIRVDG
ncbi:UV DNA damage repair endonuclease UvsE [Bhargavaea ullalensis]|uniref:UV DNA damage endonuclease n=1 Tax=Bhargavaea ullalensis TaxID=1265685 RepID=A0ABV2G872_9BACL